MKYVYLLICQIDQRVLYRGIVTCSNHVDLTIIFKNVCPVFLTILLIVLLQERGEADPCLLGYGVK